MLLSTTISSIALLATGVSAAPATAPSATCAYPTFKMQSPTGPSWGEGYYARSVDGGSYGSTPVGKQLFFNTNQTSQSPTFTVDPATGRLYLSKGVYAYWIGDVPGAGAQVNFGNSQTIANVNKTAGSSPGATVVKCQVPAKTGDVLVCDPDGSGKYREWLTCYSNQQSLSLIVGKPTGPYASPNPTQSPFPSCGSVKVVADQLGCTNTSPK